MKFCIYHKFTVDLLTCQEISSFSVNNFLKNLDVAGVGISGIEKFGDKMLFPVVFC